MEDRVMTKDIIDTKHDAALAQSVQEALIALKDRMTACTNAGLTVWVGCEEGYFPKEVELSIEVARKYHLKRD
jgi:hypothetical protein